VIRKKSNLTRIFLADAQVSLSERYLPRIVACLQMISEKEIWWRPNRASNSLGNLVLHLSGNVRQWIVSGLGGVPDRRRRDHEFSERGPIPRPALIGLLNRTVAEACLVLQGLKPSDLSRQYRIQGFRVTGMVAISHVMEHFGYHTGQIIFLTKMKRAKDLGFTQLPGEKRKKRAIGRTP
jgi:uncharacterized damage-inducible protein DinB